MDVDDVRESDVRVSVSNRAGDSTRLDVRCQACRERVDKLTWTLTMYANQMLECRSLTEQEIRQDSMFVARRVESVAPLAYVTNCAGGMF